MTLAHPRRAIITGTGGLGLEVALQLASDGWDVVLAGRNAAAGSAAMTRIADMVRQPRASFEPLDLASLVSIGQFADRMRETGLSLDLLVNNAGIMSPPQRRQTSDGFELQLGVNHLGHFALTAGLLPLLQRAPAARVVSVTSLAMHHAKGDPFADLQCEARYRAGPAYCRSKLFQAMFAAELQRRSASAGWNLSSFAAHPGFASTNLFGAGPGGVQHLISKFVIGPLIGQSAAEGARSILYAATSHDAVPGALYGPKGRFEMKGPPGRCEFAAAVHDPALTGRLWDISEQLTFTSFETAAARS